MDKLYDGKTHHPAPFAEQYLVLVQDVCGDCYWELDMWGRSYKYRYEIGSEAVFDVVWKFQIYDNVLAWAPLPDMTPYKPVIREDLLDES